MFSYSKSRMYSTAIVLRKMDFRKMKVVSEDYYILKNSGIYSSGKMCVI
jgi:hypothetical protein